MSLPGHTVGTPTTPDALVADAARLRLLSARLERGPAGMSRVVVEFERGRDGAVLMSRQEGTACPGGDLRLAALATFAVLSEAVQGSLRFELIGVKPVRAFDTTVMMVAATVKRDDTATRVVGAAVVEDNEVQATVRAALHAVNRLVAPILGPLAAHE